MRPELKYGLIAGIGSCAWIMVEFLLGFHTTRLAIGAYSGYFPCLILLAALFVLLKGKRDQSPDRRLDYWPALKSGLHAAFISGAIVYAFTLVYSHFINPGWQDLHLDWQVANLRAAGIAETAIREEIKLYRLLHSPVGCLLSLVAGTTLLGGVFSAGLTWLLRRRPRR